MGLSDNQEHSSSDIDLNNIFFGRQPIEKPKVFFAFRLKNATTNKSLENDNNSYYVEIKNIFEEDK